VNDCMKNKYFLFIFKDTSKSSGIIDPYGNLGEANVERRGSGP
jgi:hypothetical protein